MSDSPRGFQSNKAGFNPQTLALAKVSSDLEVVSSPHPRNEEYIVLLYLDKL